MIDTSELRGAVAKEHYSQAEVARKIGMTPKTFYSKMKKGVFGSDEIDAMIRLLHIKDPASIFFASEVT